MSEWNWKGYHRQTDRQTDRQIETERDREGGKETRGKKGIKKERDGAGGGGGGGGSLIRCNTDTDVRKWVLGLHVHQHFARILLPPLFRLFSLSLLPMLKLYTKDSNRAKVN